MLPQLLFSWVSLVMTLLQEREREREKEREKVSEKRKKCSFNKCMKYLNFLKQRERDYN